MTDSFFFPRNSNKTCWGNKSPNQMTFSPPAFISIGDEYNKKDLLPDRFKGKCFKTNPGKKGNGVDAFFGKKVLSLCEGDKYVDPGYYDRKSTVEKEKKRLKVHPQPFRYTSATKKPTGSGTYFGTFCEKTPWQHMVEFDVTKKGEAPDHKKPLLKNIVTSPPKKGTYGYAGVTISKGDEFKYVSDPYDGEKRKEALKAKEASQKVVGAAFKPACKRGNFFDESAHGFPKVFTIDKPLPARRPPTAEAKAQPKLAWKPAGALVQAITKPPEYMEDPYEAKEKIQREQRLKEKPKTTWKPISAGSKTLPTRPIKFTPS